jgi:3-hydroxypropanoate dehydrogenase
LDRRLDDEALDLIFRDARTHNVFDDRPVGDDDLKAIFDLMKMGPTTANSCPARFVFLRGAAAKERLRPHLSAGNADKTVAAPVTAIIAHDLAFYEHLDRLFPHDNARPWFEGKDDHIRTSAFRNGSLQGAYFIIAARSLGYDCGPMSGFDNAGVDEEFLAGTTYKSNFLCNIGHGDASKLFPRNPRFDFDDVCEVL